MAKVEPDSTDASVANPAAASSGRPAELHHNHSMKQQFDDMIHNIHLSPSHKLLTDEKVLKRSLNALKFAVFADALCAQILQPNFALMISPGAHKDSWDNTDPFDLTAAQYFLPGMAGVATAFASIGFGALSDKIGRRPCMLICLYFGAFGSALKYFMKDTFWGFSIANFINGLFGASSVVGMAYISDVYPHDKKKKEEEMGGIMGIYMLSMNLGGIIAILMEAQGLFAPLWLGVALSLVAALYMQFELVEPDRGLHHETDAKTDSATEAGPSADDKKEGDEEEGGAPKTLNKKLLWIIVIGSIIDNIGSSGPMFGVYPVMWDTFMMDPWLEYEKDYVNYAVCLNGTDATESASTCVLPDEPNPPMSFNSYKWVSTMFGLGILPTLIISGPTYAKLGFGGGCVLGNFLTAVHCIILLYMGKMDATSTNYGLFIFAIYFGFPFTYLSQFTTGPMLDAITPEDMRGTINGVNNFAMSIAMSLAPFLLGLVGDEKGNGFLVCAP
jgi:MFS family permease